MSYLFAEYEPKNAPPAMARAFRADAARVFPIKNYMDDQAQETAEEGIGEADQDQLGVMALNPEELTPEQRFIRIKTLMERYDIAGALDYALSTLSAGELPPELHEEVLEMVDRALSYLVICGREAEAQEFRYAVAPYLEFDSPEQQDIGNALELEDEMTSDALNLAARIEHLNATDPLGTVPRPSGEWVEEADASLDDRLKLPAPSPFGFAA